MLSKIRGLFRSRPKEIANHHEVRDEPAQQPKKNFLRRLWTKAKPVKHGYKRLSDSSGRDETCLEIKDAVPEGPPPPQDVQQWCKEVVASIFPDICPDYLEETARKHGFNEQVIIDHLLGSPTYRKKSKGNQRKPPPKPDYTRPDVVNAYVAMIDTPGRRAERKSRQYLALSEQLLRQEFAHAGSPDVASVLAANGKLLLPAYIALHDRFPLWDGNGKLVKTGSGGDKTLTRADLAYPPRLLDEMIHAANATSEHQALQELRAARWVVRARAVNRGDAERKKRAEQANFARAQAEGTVMECQCCFDDFAMNRMVHCNGDEEHWFCIQCAKRTAETVIGYSRCELKCLSTTGCSAGFAMDQRKAFLDDKLLAALDRIEADTVLLMAGIPNLETCPACPYAAECPPVEEDKEFRCDNPECLRVSCRLCRGETHLPRSCKEVARDRGMSARRYIEEAMSAAVIRRCNKCQTPFIKVEGCNKMTCARQGCQNVQCYVCSQSCTYEHFNDGRRRRGKRKRRTCPLWDSHEARHKAEVQRAEEAARRKVMAENPGISPELLQIRMAKDVEMKARLRRYLANAKHVYQGAVAVPKWFLREMGRGLLRNPIPDELMGVEYRQDPPLPAARR